MYMACIHFEAWCYSVRSSFEKLGAFFLCYFPCRLVAKGETLGPKSKRSRESRLLALGWGATEENELARWLYSAQVMVQG